MLGTRCSFTMDNRTVDRVFETRNPPRERQCPRFRVLVFPRFLFARGARSGKQSWSRPRTKYRETSRSAKTDISRQFPLVPPRHRREYLTKKEKERERERGGGNKIHRRGSAPFFRKIERRKFASLGGLLSDTSLQFPSISCPLRVKHLKGNKEYKVSGGLKSQGVWLSSPQRNQKFFSFVALFRGTLHGQRFFTPGFGRIGRTKSV